MGDGSARHVNNFLREILFFSQNIRIGFLHITLTTQQVPLPYVSLPFMGIRITLLISFPLRWYINVFPIIGIIHLIYSEGMGFM